MLRVYTEHNWAIHSREIVRNPYICSRDSIANTKFKWGTTTTTTTKTRQNEPNEIDCIELFLFASSVYWGMYNRETDSTPTSSTSCLPNLYVDANDKKQKKNVQQTATTTTATGKTKQKKSWAICHQQHRRNKRNTNSIYHFIGRQWQQQQCLACILLFLFFRSLQFLFCWSDRSDGWLNLLGIFFMVCHYKSALHAHTHHNRTPQPNGSDDDINF